VFNILKVQSQNPRVLHTGMSLYVSIMHDDSQLTRAQREMLAVVVSKANNCHY
jgi:alkylhydroperoxidase family enzyme